MMKNKAKYLALLTTILVLVFIVQTRAIVAAEDYANTAAIFEIGAGARTLGMGGAFIGLADDENAVVYNPAGLAFLEGGMINTTYDNQFNTLTYNSAVGAIENVGIAGMSLSSGLINVTDKYGIDTGSTTSYSSTGLIGGFGVTGDMIGLGARAKNLGLSLQLRSFSSTLHTSTGSGFSLSVSSLYKIKIDRNSSLQLGIIVPSVIIGKPIASGLPLGTITYKNQSGKIVHEEQFPNNFGIGIGIKIGATKERGTSMALDWRAQGGIRAGIEQRLSLGAMRFGLTASGAITVGGGIDLGALGAGNLLERASIDGVYKWHADLGNSWILSFAAKV